MTEPMDREDDTVNHWQEFRVTLKERLRGPCRHPTFVMYFVGIIVVVGGFGLLEPIVSCWVFGTLKPDAFPQALERATYTYFIAIAATAAVDLVLSYRQRKSLLMFFVLCSLTVLLCAFLAASLGNPGVAKYPSILGYVLALFLWWVGNAENANLLDTPVEPTDSIGADAETNPSGNLTGFNA